MSLLKTVRKKLMQSSSSKSQRKSSLHSLSSMYSAHNSPEHRSIDPYATIHRNEEFNYPSLANLKPITSTKSNLKAKPSDFPYLAQKDPEILWEEMKELNQSDSPENIHEIKKSIGKVYKNRITKTLAWAKIVENFSDENLDDFLVEVGIVNELENRLEDQMTEIELLRSFQHKNLIKFLDCYFFDSKLWVFTEHCSEGSVLDIMKDLNKPLNQMQIHYVVSEVLHGLVYLHQTLKLVHLDLRADNILINKNGSIKLSNFSISAKNKPTYSRKHYFFVRHPHWIAPEIAMCNRSKEDLYESFKSDIWSLGITCIEMGQMLPPKSDVKTDDIIMDLTLTNVSPTFKNPDKWSSSFIDFVSKCLDRNVETRPNAIELFDLPFMTNLRSTRNEIKTLLSDRKIKLYDIAREKIDEVETKFKSYKLMKEQPELYLFDYFQDMRNQIDLEAEKAKLRIEFLQNEMIETLKQAEMECIYNVRKINEPNETNNTNETNDLVDDNNNKNNNDNNSQKIIDEVAESLKKWSMELGERNIKEENIIKAEKEAKEYSKFLDEKLDVLKSELFLKKSYTIQPVEIEPEVFGKLEIQQQVTSLLSKEEETKNDKNELVEFHQNSKKILRLELKYNRK